ncbi:MAG: hypothetical protein LBC17_02400 [Lactobacillaceae bacterium]|jgi:MFS family permease|nr:hypothetical protein [Lactobacillaceae bacterium]
MDLINKNKKVLTGILWGLFSNTYFERAIWMLFLFQNGWSISEVAFLQGFISIVQVVLEFPSGIISDYFGHKKSIIIGELLIALYLLLFFSVEAKF